jgi:murein L,D-transpeptidase YcbB/YkuD
MTTEGQYAKLLALLKTTNDIYTATDQVCRVFEQPYYCNVDERVKNAKEIAAEIDLSCTAVVEDNTTTEEKPEEPKLETWPPRVIDEHCTGWPEVWLLQALLKCRGYNVLVDGIWWSLLTDKVKQFQQAHGLDPDGAVGPMTWQWLGLSAELFKK